MLCLALAPGEYLTIGDHVVVQFDRMSGDRCKMNIEAPREVPILRGEVLERTGGERPSCVFSASRPYKRELLWDRSKAQALAAMRTLLSQMDGEDSNVQALRRQLNHMFPPGGKPEQLPEVSNG
ncbi:MAG: carbon storage regulator [Oscillibacter sp.]|nr:carbon storage regulator [Oscillibacter sp.]